MIASGTSDRHVKSAQNPSPSRPKPARRRSAPKGCRRVGLIDLNGVVVHVMQQRVRDFLSARTAVERRSGGGRKISKGTRFALAGPARCAMQNPPDRRRRQDAALGADGFNEYAKRLPAECALRLTEVAAGGAARMPTSPHHP